MDRIRTWLAQWGQMISVIGFVSIIIFMGVQSTQTSARFDRTIVAARVDACKAVARSNMNLERFLKQEFSQLHDPRTNTFLTDLHASFVDGQNECLRDAVS